MNAPESVDRNGDDGQILPPERPAQDRSREGVRNTTTGLSLAGRRAVIVGYGPIGATVAHTLVTMGCEVIVIDDGRFNTGSAAAGWVMVYHPNDPTGPGMGVQAERLWAARGERLFPRGDVTWEKTVLERTSGAAPFPRELQQLRDFQRLDTSAPGVAETVTLSTPVAPAQLWLPHLTKILERTDRFIHIAQHISTVGDLSRLADDHNADFVVNATGMFQAEMLDDARFTLDYGMVGFLTRPEDWSYGIRSRDLGKERSWTHGISQRFGFSLPGGTADPYYVTQTELGLIKVGGCMWPMSPDEAARLQASKYKVDLRIFGFIMARAEEHFPELRGLEPVGYACSIRPSRDRFLLEWDGVDRRVLHVGGAGGAGITLAPVFAERVAASLELRIQSSNGC